MALSIVSLTSLSASPLAWDWGNSSRHSFMMSVGAPAVSVVEDRVTGSPPAFQGVAFQGFDWGALSDRASQYKNIESAAKDLAAAGIDAVWFPPPSKSVDTQGYMPQQWYELVGDATQRSAVAAVAAAGMVPVADVVVNHRTAPAQDGCTHEYTSFAEPTMGDDAVVKNDYKCGSGDVFCSGCGCNNYDTGDNFCGCPDLDHSNSGVQSLVKDYLTFLHGVGYRGWRFDMVKGYGPSYVGGYVAASSPAFAVGEFFDSDVSKVESWVSGTSDQSAAFDFPLRATLKNAVASNDYSGLYGLPGLIGRKAANAVTFVDNHDTARNDRFGDADAIKMAYALLLTHPGTPCVFWGDWVQSDVQATIRTLLKVRSDAGLTSTSSWRVVQTVGGLYAAYVGESVAVKLGSNDWSPTDKAYMLKASGNNFAVWAK